MGNQTKGIAKTQSHQNIYEALSALQGELKPLKKNAKVEFPTQKGGDVKFEYTTLDKIMEYLYPLLGKHGLSVRHEVNTEGVQAILTHNTYKVTEVKKTTSRDFEGAAKEEVVETELREENVIRSGVVKIASGGDMKDVGSAITYARRYTLTMLFGIASEEDTDAPVIEESKKNAQKFAFTRAKDGISKVKTVKELEKQMKLIDSDMQKLKDGKAPTLGLPMDDYIELQELAEVRLKELNEDGKTVE